MAGKKVSRSTATEWFVFLTNFVASKATCPRFHAGAVIVRDNRIISTGYNSSPSGSAHCEDVGCLILNDHCKRSTHAEQNAIINAARVGVSTVGATMFIKGHPCVDCAKHIVNSGITHVVLDLSHGYHRHQTTQSEDQRIAETIMRESGVDIAIFNGDFFAPIKRFLAEFPKEELAELKRLIEEMEKSNE